MLIYNVTINIEESVHDSWLKWMKEIHIPEVLSTGKFIEAKIVKVLVEEEMGGFTYSIQFLAADKESLARYYTEDAKALREKTAALFGDKIVAFRTELEVISEHKRYPIKATEYLFSYGSLQDISLQQSLLGRTIHGIEEKLFGYKISKDKIGGEFLVAEPSKNAEDYISGVLYVLSHMDVSKIDSYEGPSYKRVKLTMDSGKKAWTYIRKEEEGL